MEWFNDICEGRVLNFMSYARGDFYVKTVRSGLRDNQIIIPLTAGIDSRGDYNWKLWWISFALANHGCHNGTHSNWFHCTEHILLLSLESVSWRPVSPKVGKQRFPVQEFRTRLSEISVYSSSKEFAFSTLFPEVLADEQDEIHSFLSHECDDPLDHHHFPGS